MANLSENIFLFQDESAFQKPFSIFKPRNQELEEIFNL